MFSNDTYNFLRIENVDKIPFPSQIKDNLAGYDWSNHTWNTFGLPAFHSTFTITGDQLYFEKDADDNMALRKEDWSGQILASCVIPNPNNCGEVYFLTFELTFCHGTLSAATLKEFKTQPKVDYDTGLVKFQTKLAKSIKLRNSWYFKWLYLPYFYLLKWISVGVVFVVEFILRVFCWIVDLLLPIKI